MNFWKKNTSTETLGFKCRSQLKSLEKLAWAVLRRNDKIAIKNGLFRLFQNRGSFWETFQLLQGFCAKMIKLRWKNVCITLCIFHMYFHIYYIFKNRVFRKENIFSSQNLRWPLVLLVQMVVNLFSIVVRIFILWRRIMALFPFLKRFQNILQKH